MVVTTVLLRQWRRRRRLWPRLRQLRRLRRHLLRQCLPWLLRLQLGTTLIFDVGVYLVVVGMSAAVILPFIDGD